ncbi:MAG: Dabb family protein [Spirochaetaceae bacterium]
MITHVVMWTVKEDGFSGKEEASRALKAKLETMYGTVSHFVSLEVGLNQAEGAAACDVVLITRHRDAEQLERYRVDPVHKEVAAWIGEHTASRAVVDFES